MNFIQAVTAARRVPAPSPGGIVTTNLVFHIDPSITASYPGSGSTIYDLVGSTNGSFQGGVYVDANGHLILDGVNDAIYFGLISISVPVSLYNTSWTISAWAYNNNSGESFQYFWSQWSDSSGTNRFDFFRSLGSASNAFRIDVSGTPVQISAAGGFPAYTWYYLTATFDDTTNTLTLYRNGVYQNSGTSQNTANVSKYFRIGSRGYTSSGNEWNGKLGAFHVYNRELSTSEILQNFNATKATYGL